MHACCCNCLLIARDSVTPTPSSPAVARTQVLLLSSNSDSVGSPDSISLEDLMETNKMPMITILKEKGLGWLGHAAWQTNKCMIKQLVFVKRVPGHVQPIEYWMPVAPGCIMYLCIMT